MNYQYVTDLNSLPENQPVKVDVAGTTLILIRTLGQVRAFQEQMPPCGRAVGEGGDLRRQTGVPPA